MHKVLQLWNIINRLYVERKGGIVIKGNISFTIKKKQLRNTQDRVSKDNLQQVKFALKGKERWTKN